MDTQLGPAAAGSPGKNRPKKAQFSSYIGQDGGLGPIFLDPAGWGRRNLKLRHWRYCELSFINSSALDT